MADLNIAVRLSANDQASGPLGQVTRSVRELERQAGSSTPTLARMEKGLATMQATAVGLGAAAAVFKEAFDLGAEGAQIEATAERFEALNDSVGALADDTLLRLQDAVDGSVSRLDLMASSNLLLSTGAASSSDELENIIESVVKLKKPTEDAATAIENFSLLLANKSIPRLDSYGLSASKVRERYEELKKTVGDDEAFRTAVFEEMQVALENVGQAGDFSADAFTRVSTRIQDLTDAFKVNMAEGLEPWLQLMMDDIGEAAQEGTARLIEQGAGIDKLTEAYRALKDAIFETRGMKDARAELWEQILLTVESEEQLGEIMRENGFTTRGQISYQWKRAQALQAEAEIAAELAEQNARMAAGYEYLADSVRGYDYAIDGLDLEALALVTQDTQFQFNQQDRAIRGATQALKPYVEAETQAAKAGMSAAEAQALLNEQLAEQEAALSAAFQAAVTATDDLVEYDERTGQTVVNQESLNQALYDSVAAAGASATELAVLGVSLGVVSQEAASAALKTALIQEGFAGIAKEALADGKITRDEMAAIERRAAELVQSVNSMDPLSFEVDAQDAYEEMEEIRSRLFDIANTQWTAVVNVVGNALDNLPGFGVGTQAPTYPNVPDPAAPEMPTGPGGGYTPASVSQPMSGGGYTVQVVNHFHGAVDRAAVDDLVAKQRGAFVDALAAARSRGAR